MTELDEDKAMRLAYAISCAAANMIRREAQPHINAMEALVRDYITRPGTADEVDWVFIFDRTMKEKKTWQTEDLTRHKSAWAKLLTDGYIPLASQVSAPEDVVVKPLQHDDDR